MTTIEAVEVRDRLGSWERGDDALYEALSRRIAGLIREGVLPADARLPAERRLADVLNISRGTVMAAYEQLRERGLVQTRHGSGTVVRSDASPVTGPREAHVNNALPHNSIYTGMLRLDESAIDLRGAYWVGTDDLPDDAFDAVGRDLAAHRDGHGYMPLGLPALRELIAQQLTTEGVPTRPQEVLVTTGAQQAISMIAELLVGQGDAVAVEEPTFPGALESFLARQATIRWAPTSAAGVDLNALDRTVRDAHARLVYLIPSIHNPTGVSMPGPARQRLVELAAGWDAVIVDDRTLSSTAFEPGAEGPPLAALAEGPVADRILTVGSLSKSLWGGLRIGWIRGAEPLLARIARIKTLSDLGTPLASQVIAVRLLEDATDVVQARRGAIRQRHDLLVDLLGQHLPDWRWIEPAGGLCLWIDLQGSSSVEFTTIANRHAVGLVPGTVASAARAYADHLRLPYGHPPAIIEEAVHRLADAWDEYRARYERCDRMPVVV